MALGLAEQYRTAMNAFTGADFDLFEKLLLNPEAVSLQEQRTVAERLGLKGGFLSSTVNVVADPTVWVALMLSRKFPTAQFLRGTIPHRFIGAANEFSGMSVVARPVEHFFRGTSVPKLVAMKMQREAEVLKVGNKIFDEVASRRNWNEEMPLVSMLLEGQSPAGATAEHRAVADRIRRHMTELWDSFLSKTVHVEGGFAGDHVTMASARPFTPAEAPKFLRDYLPHIPLVGAEQVVPVSGKQALKRLGMGKVAQLMEVKGENPNRVWSVSESDRLGSHFARYQDFMNNVGAQVFNPRLFKRKRFNIPLQSQQGQELFVTDLNIILQKYVHGVARTYANNSPLSNVERALVSTRFERADGTVGFTSPTNEPTIVQIINEGLRAASPGGQPLFRKQTIAGTNVQRQVLIPGSINVPTMKALNNLVRAVQGMKGTDEILYGNLFNSIRHNVSTSVGGALGKRRQNQLEDAIATLEGERKGRALTNRITSYFYATTLGMNPLSALKNLFQPALTTAPAIGIGPTLQGYSVLRQRLPRHIGQFSSEMSALSSSNIPFAERLSLALERSFSKTFPELAETGIRADPRLFELSEAEIALDHARGKLKTFDDYMHLMMQPFIRTEMANQIVTFYGGKAALRQAIRRGELDLPLKPPGTPLTNMELEQFLNFEAASLVSATQFKPGPGSKTIFQSAIPAPLRMFSSFPVRLANFFAESTVRGAMTNRQLESASAMARLFQGRNWGTLARTYLYGRIANEGMRNVLGVDMSDALGITGPFNFDPSDRKFYPIPISPVPSVIMGAASFASTRDIKALQPLRLPVLGEVPVPKVLVPGGIAITRATRAMQQYRPDLGGFVDDEERLMYQGTTTDLILASLGVPLEKDRRMRRDLDILGSNKRRINDLKRGYALSFLGADFEKMSRFSRAYSEEFPELAALRPLGASRKDFKRYEKMQRMTAVQRMLQSYPESWRHELYIENIDPDLIAEAEINF